MAGMYHLKDLLLLAAQESAEELLLEPDQPPRMRLHSKVRVLDGPLLTSDQISELLRSIAADEQRRELELYGNAHFRYAAEPLAAIQCGRPHARQSSPRENQVPESQLRNLEK